MNPKHKKILIAVAIALVTFLGAKYGLPEEFINQALETIREQDTVEVVPVTTE